MEELSDAQTLLDRVRTALAKDAVTNTKRMFGGHTFMLNGNMLCCVSEKGLMVRVGAEAEREALKKPFAARCTGAGREMAGFLMIEHQGLRRDRDLSAWLRLARNYVGSLPPKAAKARARQNRWTKS